jgi:hypothetical protein
MVEYDEESKFCVLCDAGADVEHKEGERGHRFIYYCRGSCPCPPFEITRIARKEVQRKPTSPGISQARRKACIIQKIKAFTKENPDDMPVIRMGKGCQGLIVTTRSREAKKKGR